MAGRIKREDIDTVRERASIEQIVGEHVTLKPAGVGALKGLCPFHDERTPSFHVRPHMGLWHCFGCGDGGDVVSFVQRINHMSFVEAVEYLATKTGIQLRYEEGGAMHQGVDVGTRQRLMDANRMAETWFQKNLAGPQAQAGRDFLTGRGFDRSNAEYFGVGYALPGWDNLTKYLRSQGFTDSELVDSGLCTQGNRGIYDRFRDRLIWPIRDVTGATVGFGARKLSDDDQGPKYLNTPETAVYKKSTVLYGLDLAKKDIASTKRVVVVEGYTDVMAAHLSGITTAVATCGTAFGEGHVRIVRRLLGDSANPAAGLMLGGGSHTHGGEVIFTFDGDAAGQKAALRAFGEDQHFAAQTFVAVESSGMDPCEVRMARGPQGVVDLVEGRKPLFEFVIKSTLNSVDLFTPEGRVAGLRAAAPVVAHIRDVALRREYTRSLAGWLGMPEADVRQEVQRATSSRRTGQGNSADSARGSHYAQQGSQRPSYNQQPPQGQMNSPYSQYAQQAPQADGPQIPSQRPAITDPVTKLERQALEVILQMPVIASAAAVDDLDPAVFSLPMHRAIFEAILAAGGVQACIDRLQTLQRNRAQSPDLTAMATAAWLEDVREGAVDMVGAAITELAVVPLPLAEGQKGAESAYARGVLKSMTQMALTKQLAQLRSEHRRMTPSDPEYRETFQKIVDLESRRQQMKYEDLL
ncbi:DNA primase [Actinomyces vulturis]|uniref:DNA primase n=1 Tax=Actinomyces vulturis TaxID=1857645 RepID=UPI000833D4C4|nr:DNA primase [Actinomyces vulturis]